MGEFYQVVVLAEKYYLEYQCADTNWKTIALSMKVEEVKRYEEFESKQAAARMEFLKNYTFK